MEAHEGEDKRVVPSERLAHEEPGPLPPLAPDGGLPHLPLDPPPPLPKATPEEFVCLRGPCCHYVEMVSPAGVEVKVEGYEPVQVNRYCRVIPGVYLDLTEDSVFSCNRWDPEDEADLARLEHHRREYLNAHPGCAQADTARVEKRRAALEQLAHDADEREAREAAATTHPKE